MLSRLHNVSEYEHKISDAIYNICSISLMDLTEYYSKSVGYLFLYLKVNIFLYLGFFLLSFVSFVSQVYFYFTHTSIRNIELFEGLFLISKFPPSLLWILWIQWFLTICWFLCIAIGYWLLVRNANENVSINTNTNVNVNASGFFCFPIKEFLDQEDPSEGFYSQNISQNISQNPQVNKINNTSCRILQSILLFIALLSIYGMVQLGLQVGTIWIQKKHVQTQSTEIEKEDFIFIFVSSVIYSLWKWISRKACWFLTQWELHEQWASFYRSYFVKTYLFDIISFSLFYFSRVFILLQQDEEDVNLFQCYVD